MDAYVFQLCSSALVDFSIFENIVSSISVNWRLIDGGFYLQQRRGIKRPAKEANLQVLNNCVDYCVDCDDASMERSSLKDIHIIFHRFN